MHNKLSSTKWSKWRCTGCKNIKKSFTIQLLTAVLTLWRPEPTLCDQIDLFFCNILHFMVLKLMTNSLSQEKSLRPNITVIETGEKSAVIYLNVMLFSTSGYTTKLSA